MRGVGLVKIQCDGVLHGSMEGFSVSALSVPTKLSIRHRDRISLKGWVSVLWYFVDDLLLLSIDAKRWKRLVRRGCWWYLSYLSSVRPLTSSSGGILSLCIWQSTWRSQETWNLMRCESECYDKGDATFTSMLFPTVIRSWIDQFFPHTVMAATVVEHRCNLDNQAPATIFYVWTSQFSREIGLQK